MTLSTSTRGLEPTRDALRAVLAVGALARGPDERSAIKRSVFGRLTWDL
jgi:hypothetical protein